MRCSDGGGAGCEPRLSFKPCCSRAKRRCPCRPPTISSSSRRGSVRYDGDLQMPPAGKLPPEAIRDLEEWVRRGLAWPDDVRYAETRGHEFDYPIPNAWRYRDWVVQAFNDDLPYDQFVREQIAGDLIDPPRLDPHSGANRSVVGTGFWLLGEEIHAPVDIAQDEADRIDNRVDTFGKAFLGLALGCARCHDHKFDAVSGSLDRTVERPFGGGVSDGVLAGPRPAEAGAPRRRGAAEPVRQSQPQLPSRVPARLRRAGSLPGDGPADRHQRAGPVAGADERSLRGRAGRPLGAEGGGRLRPPAPRRPTPWKARSPIRNSPTGCDGSAIAAGSCRGDGRQEAGLWARSRLRADRRIPFPPLGALRRPASESRFWSLSSCKVRIPARERCQQRVAEAIIPTPRPQRPSSDDRQPHQQR